MGSTSTRFLQVLISVEHFFGVLANARQKLLLNFTMQPKNVS